jgi:hypothetical protein
MRGMPVPLPDENAIIKVLDDDWATVAQIRGRVGGSGRSFQFANVLERMAASGKIERRRENAGVAKHNNKPFMLSLYRRCATE